MKTAKQMERHLKGIGNHHRINILLLVSKNEGISAEDMARKLEANFKTISGHTVYLLKAGLINKNYEGQIVRHELSPYGELMVDFIKKFKKL